MMISNSNAHECCWVGLCRPPAISIYDVEPRDFSMRSVVYIANIRSTEGPKTGHALKLLVLPEDRSDLSWSDILPTNTKWVKGICPSEECSS